MSGEDDLEDKSEILREDDFVTPQELFAFVPGPRKTDDGKETKKTSKGLFNTSKAIDGDSSDWDDEDDTEEKEKKAGGQKKPLLSNTDCNIIMAVMNISFGIAIVLMLNVGVDADLKRTIVSVIMVIATIAACSALIWFLTCHVEPQKFQDAIIVHIMELQESDPDFARKMARVYLVGEKKYVDDLQAYIKSSVEEEEKIEKEKLAGKLIQDGIDADDLFEDELDYESDTGNRQGGGHFSDQEMIIEDNEIEDITKRTPPPSGGINEEKTRADPSKIELTNMSSQEGKSETIPQKRNPDATSPDSSPQGILRKERSTRSKSVTWSVSGTEELVGKHKGEEFQEALEKVEEDKEESEEDVEVEQESESVGQDLTELDRQKFYDLLFLAKLKPSFLKYRPGLVEICPNPSNLENMEPSDLASAIQSKAMRKRILKEAKALLQELKDDAKKNQRTDSDDEDFAADFLGGIEDSDNEMPEA